MCRYLTKQLNSNDAKLKKLKLSVTKNGSVLGCFFFFVVAPFQRFFLCVTLTKMHPNDGGITHDRYNV